MNTFFSLPWVVRKSKFLLVIDVRVVTPYATLTKSHLSNPFVEMSSIHSYK